MPNEVPELSFPIFWYNWKESMDWNFPLFLGLVTSFIMLFNMMAKAFLSLAKANSDFVSQN